MSAKGTLALSYLGDTTEIQTGAAWTTCFQAEKENEAEAEEGGAQAGQREGGLPSSVSGEPPALALFTPIN